MDFRAEYEKWCTDPYFDEATKAELKAIAGDDKEIEDRFYRTLEFGTAGLRGVIGAGTHRMNIYTVRQATQGLANYILSQGEDAVKRGVAIAHDSRNMHDEFTDATALCLAANGIKTYVFPQLAPVPELSYAVRTLGTIAGVVITASHNPREYNGYKVYWEDGAQVTPPHDTSIMAEVAKVTSFDQVKTMDKAAAIEAGLYNVISDEVEEGYFGELRKLSIHPEIIKAMAKDIKIVYTPLHGTGLRPVQRVLKDMGFENVYIEPSQAVPDGNFPTCPYPNPENPDAWKLALALAKEKINHLIELTGDLYASDMHELMFIYELNERLTVCLSVIAHLGARKETRWHSFAENLDYPDKSDDWMKYVNSRYENGQLHMIYIELVGREARYEHND